MRRLILELSGQSFENFKASSPFRNVKSLVILHLLRVDEQEIAAICRIEFLESISKEENTRASKDSVLPFEIQLLEKEKNGSLIAFIRGRPRLDLPPLSLIQKGGYVSTPFEISEGKAKVTFLGKNSGEVKAFLKRIDRTGIRYRILSLSDAKFSPDSLLHGLTQKQFRAILTAYKLGYYSIPRRVKSEELAAKLGLVPSTLNVHLRKAEFHLLSEIFSYE